MTIHTFTKLALFSAFIIFSTVLSAQTIVEYDGSSTDGQMTLTETGAVNDFSRLLFRHSSDVTNRWAISALPQTGQTFGFLESPIVFAYSGASRLMLSKDGKLNINSQYTLPNLDGSFGQVLTTDGAGNVQWTASGGGSSLWTEAQGPRYSNTGPRFASINSTNGSNTGYRFENNGLQEALIWHEISTGDLIFTNNSGSTRNMIIDGTTQYVGIGLNNTSPTEMLDVKVTGSDGIRIEGNNTGDARLSIFNGSGTHFLFDDDSDNHNLKLQSANDLVLMTGGVNERISIDGTTGEVFVSEELRVSSQITAQNGIEVRGSDAQIDFIDSQAGGGLGAQIEFSPDSGGNGNFGDLEIRNYDVVGEIEFYLSTSTKVLSLDDQNIIAYEKIIPSVNSTSGVDDGIDIGSTGRRFDDIYVDDVNLHGCAAFTDRVVTEDILNFPPTAKEVGMEDYMNQRGLVEINPEFLPNGLSNGEGGVLIDEMATYNYKANYEQQQQINDLKAENAELKNQIATILARLDSEEK
ncbi:hypothetical protein N9L92_02545 [Saprospiraceae bacterium]|nr:hypothetical protein [Saprospiraceae bacterium]